MEDQAILELRSGIEQKIKQIDKELKEIKILFDGKIDVLENKHTSRLMADQRLTTILNLREKKIEAEYEAKLLKNKFKAIKIKLQKLEEIQYAT
jgi:hypothetical protein